VTTEECLEVLEDLYSPALRRHEDSVGRMTAIIARAMGHEQSFADALGQAAALHDLGKVTLNQNLLGKPGKLDAREWEVIKTHTVHGHTVLRAANTPLAALAAPIALHHHECWDGSGYPHCLKGEAIPFGARLASLCDCYDALREVRAYKAPRSHEEVVHMILGGGGGSAGTSSAGKFDPAILGVLESQPELFRDAYDGAVRGAP
jgi:putative two-component system response regulator